MLHLGCSGRAFESHLPYQLKKKFVYLLYMKQYLTDVNDMRNWLRPLWREGYIDRQSDKDIIKLYDLMKDGLK